MQVPASTRSGRALFHVARARRKRQPPRIGSPVRLRGRREWVRLQKRPRAFARGLRWMYRDAILYPSSPATETNATQRVCGCFIRNSEYRQNQKDVPRESSRRIVRPETLDCSRKDNSGDAKKSNAADEGDSAKDRRTSGSQRHFTFGHRYHSLGIPGHRPADGVIILPMSRYFEGVFRYFRRIYPPFRIAYAYARRHMEYISHFP